MMMNAQMKLNLEDEVRKFVRDFNKFFKDLEAWTNNNAHIKTWKDHFLKEYPKIFNGSENEVELDVDVETTMETESRPIIDREEKLGKVEEKLLSNKINESFTDYYHVMSDDKLSLPQR